MQRLKVQLKIQNLKWLKVFLIFLFLITPFSESGKALGSTPPTTVASLNGTTGSNSWYVTTVDVILTASAGSSEVASTEYWVDNNAHNTVNFLPGSDKVVQFNVSSQGTHIVHYFSTGSDTSVESAKTTSSFKIDTVSPRSWTNFTATKSGNDHTFILSITVNDVTSGVYPVSARYNYTLDGTNYGYHTTTTSCNSSWVAQDPNKNPPESGSGWKTTASVSPNYNGANTVILTTDPIDFCNDNFNLNEKVQFYIEDMAGNDNTKVQVLFGSWLKVTGADVYSQGQINFGAQSEADYIVASAVSPIINMSSGKDWYLSPYDSSAVNTNYTALYTKAGSPKTALPSGKLPTVKGAYYVNGDWTIDNNNIPSNLATTKNLGAIVFVNGTLTINKDFSLDPSSSIIFVVNGDFNCDKHVENVSGNFVVDGDISIGYNGGDDSNQFVLNGSLMGNGSWFVGHDVGKGVHGEGENLITPSDQFIFQPSIFNNNNLSSLMSATASTNWNEVAP